MRRRASGTVFLVAVLGVALFGCADSDPQDAQVGADPTVAASPSPTASPPSPTASPPSPAATLTPEALFPVAEVLLAGPTGEPVPLVAHVARNRAARRQGLMGREDLQPGTGMVFLFPREHDGGFWMKDTLVPLSIAFFAHDGTVLAILDMDPCEADPCPVYNPGLTYRGALEVPQGYLADVGVEPGWRVEVPPELWPDL
jgi:uncharacterized protein